MIKKRILLVLLTLSLLTGCAKVASNIESVKSEKPVVTSLALPTVSQTGYESIGIVTGDVYTSYSSKTGGQIEKLHVKEGDMVNINSPLFEIKSDDLQRILDQSKMRVEQSRLVYEKASASLSLIQEKKANSDALYQSNALAKSSYDEILLAYETAVLDKSIAEQNYELARSQYEMDADRVNHTVVNAKQGGTVTHILKEAESYLSSGEPLIIVRNDDAIIKTGVSSNVLPKIHLGDTCLISFNALDIEGKIISIGTDPDGETMQYPIEVSSPYEDAIIGDLVTVRFLDQFIEGVTLPIYAVIEDGVPFVFTVVDNQSHKTEVTILESQDQWLIVDGLNPNDQVVVEGMRNLKHGDPVRIVDEIQNNNY